MSNPFDDDESPIKSYTDSPHTAQEKAAAYEREIERLMQASLSSTQRSVGQLESSERLGTDAARDLLAQREKLERTERNLDDIHHTTQLTQRSLNSLSSFFGGFIKNKFSKAPKKPPPASIEAPASAAASSSKLNNKLEEGASTATIVANAVSTSRSLNEESRQKIAGTRWGAMDDEIDNNLGMMSSKLANLRSLGMALGEEVEDQNKLLDRIDAKASRNDSTVRSQDTQMKKLLK